MTTGHEFALDMERELLAARHIYTSYPNKASRRRLLRALLEVDRRKRSKEIGTWVRVASPLGEFDHWLGFYAGKEPDGRLIIRWAGDESVVRRVDPIRVREVW